ncbi:epidermal retinol dehydrogenase 2-like [Stylophora pistillata]|uniref:Short-chain dehydrogenase/reductase 3 n=1 Tax=Stylophora pistillata TaxID=50429 RepID=A0A2B4RP64_STYPI|nr:epidermal retinol dehydrogenase 2-like [Stylophora pistillata]PFX18055.1 Epidermal retinol dehydrogenase 2 [Stylophora pistillata]
MALVYVLYALMIIQGILFALYFTGKGYVMSMIWEIAYIMVRVWLCVIESAMKWILPSQRKDIRGEIALVTGAASGIGRLIALGLAAKGCKLVIWDVNGDGLKVVAKEIEAAGGVVHSYECNLRNRKEISEMSKKVKEEVGEVSLLVNNAGIITGKKVMDCSDEEILATMDVNILSHFWTIKEFLPSMCQHNQGHIVSIASIAGYTGLAGAVDYCSSKFAAVGLMEALRQELLSQKKTGIQLTTVCPSLITTGMFDGVRFRFPNLVGFGTLTPQYAASKVIDAIEKNQIHLTMPRGAYLSTALQHSLPERATDLLLNFLGADVAMNTFTGRQKKGSE